MLRPGDIVRIFDHDVRPQKSKRHICICSKCQLFLRINSEPGFWTGFPLQADDCDFLEHDSYVDVTNLVRNWATDIRGAEPLGRLSKDVALALIAFVRTAKTLSSDHKNLIVARFTGPDGPAPDP